MSTPCLSNSSELRVILFPSEDVLQCPETFFIVMTAEERVIDVWQAKAGVLLNTVDGTVPTAENHPAQNISGAAVEKLWSAVR